METLAAAEVGRWIEQQATRLGALKEDEIQPVNCLVELDCHWLPDKPKACFELLVGLQLQSGSVKPVAVSLRGIGSNSQANGSFSLHSPLRLEQVHIPKPWGQEIWYTGVEQRGVCGFAAPAGESVPLPWVLETLAPWLTGGPSELVLLKILDPLPEAVWGDLYFELHEEKREVYVVTHVDKSAWPDGIGAIRFGFDSQVRSNYSSEAEFKSAYRASVAAYESVRRKIDAALDTRREQQGIALDAPLAPEQLMGWQQSLDAGLLREERALRSAMEAFTRLMPLRVGDVVKVPCYTPHALQHGVRTVEFQTPVYERKILSFAQKVLTQQHWDTDDGVALMALEPEAQKPFTVCYQSEGVLVERIVDFADFTVQRWMLQRGSRHSVELGGSYVLVMAIEGEVVIGDCLLSPEQACLVPATMVSMCVSQRGDGRATALVASPV
jgi:hypothetical protein